MPLRTNCSLSGGAYSIFKSKVSVSPTIEPVTLQEVKDWMRITFTNDDTLITSLIAQAREIAERYTGRKFINQTLIGYASNTCGDQLSYSDWDGYLQGPVSAISNSLGFLEFDWGPVQSITSLESIDIDNNETVYGAGNYYLESFDDDKASRLRFNANSAPPGSLRRSDCWKATFVAGYGTTRSNVPEGIKLGIKMLSAYLYQNRGACGEGCVSSAGAMSTLDSYRMIRL